MTELPGRLDVTGAAEVLLEIPTRPWRFGDSIAFDALEALTQATGNQKWAAYAYGFIRGWAATWPALGPHLKVAPLKATVSLARSFEDSELLSLASRLAAVLEERPRLAGVLVTHDDVPLRPPAHGRDQSEDETKLRQLGGGPGVFIDVLHFEPPFYTALGVATDDEKLLRLGVAQALGYCRLLQDEQSGLFYHFYLGNTQQRYGLGWSRGQGWAILGILEVLVAANTTGHSEIQELRDRLKLSLEAMANTQRDDGHWSARAHVGGSSVDTSAAAFYVSCIDAALAHGVLELSERIVRAADRAWDATCRAVDETGALRGATAAVGACTDDSHHEAVPRVARTAWSQGALVLAGAQAISSERIEVVG